MGARAQEAWGPGPHCSHLLLLQRKVRAASCQAAPRPAPPRPSLRGPGDVARVRGCRRGSESQLSARLVAQELLVRTDTGWERCGQEGRVCRVPLALPSPLFPPCITPCEHQGALPARGFSTGPTLVRPLQNPAGERGGQRTRRKGRLFNKERRISPNNQVLTWRT